MGKHTPGPWRLSFECVDPEWAIIATPGGAVIANVNDDHRQEANARLIAAAPEYHSVAEDAVPILEAVLEDREEATGEEDEVLRDLIARLRAAIAKATQAEGR